MIVSFLIVMIVLVSAVWIWGIRSVRKTNRDSERATQLFIDYLKAEQDAGRHT